MDYKSFLGEAIGALKTGADSPLAPQIHGIIRPDKAPNTLVLSVEFPPRVLAMINQLKGQFLSRFEIRVKPINHISLAYQNRTFNLGASLTGAHLARLQDLAQRMVMWKQDESGRSLENWDVVLWEQTMQSSSLGTRHTWFEHGRWSLVA